MAAENPPGGLLTHAREFANVVAPVTLVTALLLYFGYIGTRARLEYFGVYLDMTGLSNQDLVMSGLEVVYFPAAMLFLAILAGAIVHAAVTWLLSRQVRDRETLVLGAVVVTLGVLAVGRALVGLFNVEVSKAETPGTTPLSLALGPLIGAYGIWICLRVSGRTGPPMKQVRIVALAAIGALLVVGLFWAANSFAWAFGTGQAYEQAKQLPDRPELLIDTKERLAGLPPEVFETALASEDFRFRYGGLRLLLEADGRLYLVPAAWTSSSRTIVVPFDDSVRVQLIP